MFELVVSNYYFVDCAALSTVAINNPASGYYFDAIIAIEFSNGHRIAVAEHHFASKAIEALE